MLKASLPVASENSATTTRDDVMRFCDDAVNFFDGSYTKMQTIPRSRLQELQLGGLQYRFDRLRDCIPMLKKLSDNQGITEIAEVDDMVPLLFEHTMYKSYPPSLLENGQFTKINQFLNKLVNIDLSTIDVSHCTTIDEWMETMDRESPLLICHSSGTSGTMSFLPISKHEWDKFGKSVRVTFVQNLGDDPTEVYKDEFYAIYPYYRYGGSGHVRQCEYFVKHITGSEDRLFTAYPGRMSSDLLYLGAKLQSAAARGTLGQLKVSDRMLQRKKEYEEAQADIPKHMENFFAELVDKLKGKRIFYLGAQNLLYGMVKAGREKGLRNVFAPNSVINTGGDSKAGVTMPPDWREQVCDFVGIEQTKMCYGMTEVLGMHNQCEFKHYHFAPWVVPYVLDSETSQVLPRTGRVTGRAAFFDLSAETRWGGFITGDEFTVNWDEPCPCGRTTAYAEDGIVRLSQKRGGDDKISCAATEGAHSDAMNFLVNVD